MTDKTEVVTTALIPIQKADALDLFKNEDAALMLIEKVKEIAGEKLEELGNVDFDVKAQRDKVISVAFDVTRTKTYVETFGKDIAAELKALPKLVGANRKKIRDELDSLADKIRKPVTEWEEKKKAQEEADALAAAMPLMHEEALAINEQYDMQAAENERIRLEREEKIRKETLEKAEREKQKAIQDAIDAERKKQEAEKAKQEEDWRKRQADINKHRNNIEHQRKVNREALESLCKQCGIDEDTAMKIIRYIAMNKVKHITINY